MLFAACLHDETNSNKLGAPAMNTKNELINTPHK